MKKPIKLRIVKEVPDNSDYMIHVDRTKIPVYPPWIGKLLHPELECEGPEDFDLSKIKRSLNLQDGLAMKAKPRIFFELFGERRVYLFRSIAEDKFGNMFVPYVFSVKYNVVKLDWMQVSLDWGEKHPDVHFVRYEV